MENLLILVILLPANENIGSLGSRCVGGVFHCSKVQNSLVDQNVITDLQIF